MIVLRCCVIVCIYLMFFFSVSIASEEIFSPLSRTLRDRCGLIFKSHTRLFFQIYRKRTSIYDNMSHVECVWGEGGRGGALQENKECVTIVQWWICGSEKPKNEARKNGKKFRQYTIEDSMCVCQCGGYQCG